MKQLILHTNAISGSLPASYAQWHLQLCVLDLSSNRLSSTLPPQWGSIVSPLFSFISLRNNKLSGTLPPEYVEAMCDTASYYTRYTPFIHLIAVHTPMYTYVHLCTPVIPVYTPYIHL